MFMLTGLGGINPVTKWKSGSTGQQTYVGRWQKANWTLLKNSQIIDLGKFHHDPTVLPHWKS